MRDGTGLQFRGSWDFFPALTRLSLTPSLSQVVQVALTAKCLVENEVAPGGGLGLGTRFPLALCTQGSDLPVTQPLTTALGGLRQIPTLHPRLDTCTFEVPYQYYYDPGNDNKNAPMKKLIREQHSDLH